jgi:hypothetical protein
MQPTAPPLPPGRQTRQRGRPYLKSFGAHVGETPTLGPEGPRTTNWLHHDEVDFVWHPGAVRDSMTTPCRMPMVLTCLDMSWHARIFCCLTNCLTCLTCLTYLLPLLML